MLIILMLLNVPLLSISALNTLKFKPQLVVILLDGVRWDYFNHFHLTTYPGYQQFFENGIHAEYMETVFPSDSFPSWTSLQTGLYPESHGILGNFVFSKENGEALSISDEKWCDTWWKDVEPIWITAKKHGLRVATYQWTNAHIPYDGMLPDVVSSARNKKILTLKKKIRNAKKKLKAGFDLVMIYHGGIDNMGHEFGPTHSKVKKEMKYVGQQINNLFTFVQNNSFSNKLGDVQIILVSDHGMTNVCPPIISYFMHFDAIELTSNTPNTIFTKEGKMMVNSTKNSFVHKGTAQIEIYTEPKNAEKLFEKFRRFRGYQTFLKSDIPEEFHYKKGKNAPDLIMIDEMKPSFLNYCGGRHGFSPKHPDMRAIFLAWGSAFRTPQNHPPMHIVDVYQIMCHILQIKPMAHNGSWDRIRCMMKQEQPWHISTSYQHN